VCQFDKCHIPPCGSFRLGVLLSQVQKSFMFPEIFDYETNYYWGELVVRLVPMFGFKKYKAQENELLWVYDTNKPDDGYHVPARNLSTYKY
jgi:hypothetical protein